MTPEQIIEIGRGYAHLVNITEAENRALTVAGLVKKMPPNWDGQDIYARYSAVGIELVP
jgi:hypothetical protein